MGVSGQRHAPGALYLENRSSPIVRKVGWVPVSAWTGKEILATTGCVYQDY